MLKWIMRRWRQAFAGESPTLDPSGSKRYLNALRQNELSVVAAMRRGEPVNTAPRQSLSATTASQRPENAAIVPPRAPHPGAADSATTQAVDFATSLVIGAGTGSALAGALAGGSIAGGLVGAALSVEEAAHASLSAPQECVRD